MIIYILLLTITGKVCGFHPHQNLWKNALQMSRNVFIGFAIVDNLWRTSLSVFLYRSMKKKKLTFTIKTFLYFAFSRYSFFRS
jgi:hypothetical protein